MDEKWYVLDEDGSPVPQSDSRIWSEWFATADRTMAKDKFGDVTVSTVFLGIDHQFAGGPPILWETMIFGGTHDGYQERYSTREEALAGHAVAVEIAKVTQ